MRNKVKKKVYKDSEGCKEVNPRPCEGGNGRQRTKRDRNKMKKALKDIKGGKRNKGQAKQ